ncbi:MAG TPA: phenylalanine--tRNA ligase beta subunit-related protein [Thermoanaerobaculia bacterium]|nr:phenylalanine--tRNA ligase beta subunit-related protein [Thermoanaerobaculia bacterium]
MHTVAPHPTITIAADVRARVPGLFVETATADGLTAAKESPWLDDAVAGILDRWNAGAADELSQVPEILSYRELSRRFSEQFGAAVPAVENVVTRYVMKGKFPRINALVDAANVASLRNLIPVGLFDLHSISGGLTLGIAGGDEEIVPLGKTKSEAVPRGFPVLRDEEKVISIVGVRDSAHTMIVPATTAVLAFSWGIETIPRESVRATLNDCIELCRTGAVSA